MSFGRALTVGLLITVVATCCYVVSWEILYYAFVPDFADRYAAYVLEQARAAGATDAQLAARSAEMAQFREMYRNPFYNVAMTAIEPLPVGVLFSLLAAGVLGRRRRAVRPAVA